jgi:hypothetical protein
MTTDCGRKQLPSGGERHDDDQDGIANGGVAKQQSTKKNGVGDDCKRREGGRGSFEEEVDNSCGRMTNGCGRIMDKVAVADYVGQRQRSDGGMMRSSTEMREDNGKQQDFATRTAAAMILEEVEVAGMGLEGRRTIMLMKWWWRQRTRKRRRRR